MVMELFLLRGRSEKEMDGLDRFLGFEIVRAGGNDCWIGAGGFARGCDSQCQAKPEVAVRKRK